jgi:HlyD family secretion protein
MRKEKKGSLLLGLAAMLIVVVIVALVGVFALQEEEELITGEAEATEYRVSGKVPGRIEEFRFEEGDHVKKGDTVVVIYSPEVEAKMAQASAARRAANAINKKAQHGARSQQIEGAYELYQKAQVAEEIYRKSYERVKGLYEKGVVAAQKYDEVEAQYQAAVATTKAAKSQYDMALEGARAEDKEAAEAQVARVDGIIREINLARDERYLLSPVDGEVAERFPKTGELVGQGSPIMSIVDLDDMWFTFAVREDMLKDITVGRTMKVKVPALGDEEYEVKVTYIRAMGTYATWRSTKQNGGYDVKTFDVRVKPVKKIENLRPGMTGILYR